MDEEVLLLHLRYFRESLSFQTLFTAFLGVAIWALFRDWTSGLLIVLLLYIHEMGHLIAALVRRLKIRQGPTFIPGLGAFVMVEEGENPVDSLFLYLGGPVIGAAGALLLFWLGVQTRDPHFMWAGRWGLWINLVNLIPLQPFDGGRVIRWTGRIGMIAGLIGAALIALLTDLIGAGFIGLGLSATWRAIKRARFEMQLPLMRRLVILGVYLLTGGLIFLTLRLIPATPMPPSEVIPALQPLSWGALAYCALYLLGQLLAPWGVGEARSRYGLMLLFGWPRLLLRPWRLLLASRLFAATLGSNQWHRLLAQIQHAAKREEPGAGEAAAWVYDGLARTKGRPEADRWWAELMPSLMKAGASVAAEAHQTLAQVSQQPGAEALRQAILTQDWDPASLEPSLATSLAQHLRQEGRITEALPYARRSLSTDNADSLIQFGKLCLELGELVEAEWAYRAAVDLKRSPGVLMGLGEVLMRQGRPAQALKLGYEALHKRITDLWGQDEPTEEEINVTLQRWQEESHPPGEE